MSTYDSTQDTMDHIAAVRRHLDACIDSLRFRATVHDASKLLPPEKQAFDEVTPLLAGLTYGSPEYYANTAKLSDALDHHYLVNSHHPQHYIDGINSMTLLDLIEMLCDWKAASERHNDGDIIRSIIVNKERFAISDQLTGILERTCRELEWCADE